MKKIRKLKLTGIVISLNKTLLTMKLILIFSLFNLIQLSASVYSQNTQFRLKTGDLSLKEVFKEIETQTDYRFAYRESFIDDNESLAGLSKDMSVENFLEEVVKELGYGYVVLKDNLVVITAKDDKLLKQEIVVKGKITDVDGNLLPGVNIIEKGTTNGTITNIEGEYTLTVSSGDAILQFSYIGYNKQELMVGQQTVIDVTLTSNVEELDEVIVVGYTVERKKDIIGSVAIVDTEEMLSTASGSMESQLQGRVAGVTISSTGTPGGSARVRIRGFGSFTGSDPLYIIDGVAGDINRINSNDIASVQILKDAASAAVYGARAANGVVIVTTKQGKPGAIRVDYDGYYGVDYFSKSNFPDLLNAQEYGEMYWKAMEGAGRQYGDADWSHDQYGSGPEPVIPEYVLVNVNGVRYGGASLESLRTSNPSQFNSLTDPNNYDFATHQIVKSADTDWFDEVFDPAPIQNHNLSVSGGSDNGTFMLGLNYFDQQSTADRYSYFTRYSLRANSNFKIGKIIRIGENMQVMKREHRDVKLASAAWTFAPLIPVYDIMGNPASSATPGLVSVGDTGRNPVTEPWRNRFDGTETWSMLGNVYADINILKDLVARSQFGIDYYSSHAKDLTQKTYEHYENTTTNSLSWEWNNFFSYTWTNSLTFNKTFGNHTVKVFAATESVQDLAFSTTASRSNYSIQDDPDFLVLDSGTGTQSNEGTFERSTLFSLIGKLDYSFADKYIFNATLRRDGSSKFGENNRNALFPSASVGWRISSESFMQNLSWLTDLKLRASYGIIGNQTGLTNVNQYYTYVSDDAQSYPVTGSNSSYSPSYTLDHIGNPDAKWEKGITTNIGFDATIREGKLMLNFDYFVKEVQDLLVQNQAPTTGSNATQPYVNVGNMKNTGIDFSVTNRGTITRDLRYEVSANFTTYTNEVTQVLDNPEATITGGSTRLGNVTLTKAGYPVSMFYGYQTDGFFNSEQEVTDYANAGYENTWLPAAVGRWRIKDVSGPDGVPDQVINDYDRTFIGSPHPDFQIGVNASLQYKGFDLGAFLFWNKGGEIFNYSRYNTDFMTFQYNRSARMLYDSWTPDHTGALLPKLDVNDSYSNKYATDYFVEDASYVRLKNLQLGYTLPQSMLNKIKVRKLRIYVQAQNLFTITNFSGLDPDSSLQSYVEDDDSIADLSMGVVNNITPTPKQFLVGINLGF